MRFGKLASTALMLAAFTAGVHVSAGPPAPRTRAALAPAIALSLGAPNDGRLLAGSHLEPSSVIRVIPAFANADLRWGLPALVRRLERVALRVSQKYPGSIMSVGDISRRAGGEQRACEPHPRKRSGSLPSERQAPARRH